MKINTAVIVTGLIALIGIVILFNVYSVLVPAAGEAGDDLGDAQRCTDASGVYNTSTLVCQNQTGATYTITAYQAVPLGSLFGTGGAIAIILMAALLLMVVPAFLMKGKK